MFCKQCASIYEELGQFDTILSNKMVSLTCNQMDLLRCSIARVSYGVGSNQVEIAAAKQMESDVLLSIVAAQKIYGTVGVGMAVDHKKLNWKVGLLVRLKRQGNWMNEPNSGTISLFFQILCHAAISRPYKETVGLPMKRSRQGLFLLLPENSGLSSKDPVKFSSLEKDILLLQIRVERLQRRTYDPIFNASQMIKLEKDPHAVMGKL